MNSDKKKFFSSKATDIAECALFVALMTAGAYIKIPFPLVPLTFQTVLSIAAGLLLGAKKGATSMAVYCVCGLVGLPVFSAGGGIYYLLKPSFGYILGFILSAAVAGLVSGKSKRVSLPRLVAASLAAFSVNYLVGVPYCIMVVSVLELGDLVHILVYGNLVYMPKDLVLSIFAALIAAQVRPVIMRRKN